MGKQEAGTKRFNPRRNRWESHTGHRWAPAAYSIALADLRQPHHPAKGALVRAADREALLDRVTLEESLEGWDVVRREPHAMTLARTMPVSHFTHLLLTVLTLGVWAVVWINLSIGRETRRKMLSIDEQGHVWLREP